jgi:hypothetical protein
MERKTLEEEKREWKERVSLNLNQQNIVRTLTGSTNRGTEPSQDANHTLPFKPQRQPNGANYLYSMIRKYKKNYSTGEISIRVMKDITKQWQEYHLNELSNIVNALGYEFKFGNELTDWKKRLVKIKIKFRRKTLYLIPVKRNLPIDNCS